MNLFSETVSYWCSDRFRSKGTADGLTRRLILPLASPNTGVEEPVTPSSCSHDFALPTPLSRTS